MKNSLIIAATAALALTACDKAADKPVDNSPLEQIEAPGGDWTAVVSETPEGGFVMGNPNAKVKLVEFASLTCPHCAEFEKTAMQPLIDTYVKSGQVSFELRNFVRDAADLTATLVSRCNGSASYFGLTRQLFAEQQEWLNKLQSADQASLQALDALPPQQKSVRFAELMGMQDWAAQRGLPAAKVNACLTDQGAIDRLVAMQTEATSQYNVPGTPAFLINGELVETEAGTPLWQQLEAKLRDAI
jgi:protein-disulfide isomerase